MNKAELVAALAESEGITKVAAGDILATLGGIVVRQLNDVGEITLPGIGKLITVQKEATTRRNPQTGGTVNVPAKTAVRFKASKTLKDAVN